MNSSTFNSLPSNIMAYWVSRAFVDIFKKSKALLDFGEPKQGMATSDNNKFLRQWFEVSIYNEYFDATDSINAVYTGKKWFPYNKGGEFRKWYGNQDYVVNYYLDGKEVKSVTKNGKIASRVQNTQFYFNESISWSKISGGSISFRYYPNGFLFDVAGCSVFIDDKDTRNYICGVLNSSVTQYILSALSPTINFEVGQIATVPIILDPSLKEDATRLVDSNMQLSKKEWDSFEESWNFKKHPLV